jgi:hypothetical protein
MADETTTLFRNVGCHLTGGAALHVTDYLNSIQVHLSHQGLILFQLMV